MQWIDLCRKVPSIRGIRGPPRAKREKWLGPLASIGRRVDNSSALTVHIEHKGHIMHTISVINAKGGVGNVDRTAPCRSIRTGRAQHRISGSRSSSDVCPLERTASRVGAGRTGGFSGRLREELERVAAAGADVVYLDTPPRWAGSDTAARAAARVSDTMIVPTRPSIVDLEATMDTIERIRSVSTARVIAVLNGCLSRGKDPPAQPRRLPSATWKCALSGSGNVS